MEYYLYEETIDEQTGQAMEHLHAFSAKTYVEAQELLVKNPRYQGIDCYDGKEWHTDVTKELKTDWYAGMTEKHYDWAIYNAESKTRQLTITQALAAILEGCPCDGSDTELVLRRAWERVSNL